MDNAQSQLVEKLKSSNNILVTVSRNPSVDQLAATVGLTLILNKLNKHATAVFSGEIPSTIEFLEPEHTLEKNTDSLRDFIIALDKSKADKLRYKVEDQLVRIFITPYRTSIDEHDLEFSQGDFNVDMVVALGVKEQDNLDEAITAHGRILHDATVTSINVTAEGGLGTIAWHQPQASSLSELVVELSHSLDKGLIDGQIATALLTGIVAETKRFSNERTTPQTMSISAELLAAGANQQLVATKLDNPIETKPAPAATPTDIPNEAHDQISSPSPAAASPPDASTVPVLPKRPDGTLEIMHNPDDPLPETQAEKADMSPAPVEPVAQAAAAPDVPAAPDQTPAPEQPASVEPWEPPTATTTLPSDSPLSSLPDPAMPAVFTEPTVLAPLTPLVTDTNNPSLISPDNGSGLVPEQSFAAMPDVPAIASQQPAVVSPSAWEPPTTAAAEPNTISPIIVAPEAPMPLSPMPSPTTTPLSGTLADIEQAVRSQQAATPDLGDARDEVSKALTDSADKPEAIAALNAQPLGDELHGDTSPTSTFADTLQQTIPAITAYAPATTPPVMPWNSGPAITSPYPSAEITQPAFAPSSGSEFSLPPVNSVDQAAPTVSDSTAPPPVPPPIPFRFGNTTETSPQ